MITSTRIRSEGGQKISSKAATILVHSSALSAADFQNFRSRSSRVATPSASIAFVTSFGRRHPQMDTEQQFPVQIAVLSSNLRISSASSPGRGLYIESTRRSMFAAATAVVSHAAPSRSLSTRCGSVRSVLSTVRMVAS